MSVVDRGVGCVIVIFWIVVVVVGGMFTLVSIWTYPVRYRLTVEIETPSGLRSGSSVIAATWQWNMHPSVPLRRWASGEAIYVDLGGGKHVITLLANGLRGEGSDWVFDNWYGFFASNRLDIDDVWGKLSPQRASMVLRPRDLPTLVTFTDINDPTTATVVYAGGSRCPLRPGNNVCTEQDRTDTILVDRLEAALGPGHRFGRMTMAYVDPGLWITHVWPIRLLPVTWPRWLFGEPVTRGIEGRLPWLAMRYDDMRNKDGSALSREQRNFLSSMSFRRNW
jgi:hypothetical protein